MEKEFFTIEETANKLSVSVWTIRRWIRERKIDYVKIEGSIRIPAIAIERKISESFVKSIPDR